MSLQNRTGRRGQFSGEIRLEPGTLTVAATSTKVASLLPTVLPLHAQVQSEIRTVPQ